jgi:hypothetical protein
MQINEDPAAKVPSGDEESKQLIQRKVLSQPVS